MKNLEDLKTRVHDAFVDREKLKDPMLREGRARDGRAAGLAASSAWRRRAPNGWEVNAWVKEAILLFFAVSEMKVMEVGPFEFHDKVPLEEGPGRGGRAGGAAGHGALRRLRASAARW